MLEFSTFLFANPSFSEGAGRILDFGNTLSMYNTSETGYLADYRAASMDGRAVASDMRAVLGSQPGEHEARAPRIAEGKGKGKSRRG